MEGPLSKWTNVMQGWQYRWFVLDEEDGLLNYYTSKEKMIKQQRRGCVRLKGAVVGIDDEDESTFTITVEQKMFHFQARDAEERERWVRALEVTIHRHSGYHRAKGRKPFNSGSDSRSADVAEFERKIQEADAYLQLMIDQIKTIEAKALSVEGTEQQERWMRVVTAGNAMLESVKHTIVLLQICKSQAWSSNGYSDGRFKVDLSPRNSESSAAAVGTQVLNSGSSLLRPTNSAQRLAVPLTSYSSSDDEEMYFDTLEDAGSEIDESEPEESPSTDRHNSVGMSEKIAVPSLTGLNPTMLHGSHLDFQAPDNTDFDSLYDDDDDDEIQNMQEHGSVVMHLLSQVSVGMDLTKITLPTFILERRSLLEMYADFFAHPDLFVQIADQETAEDRMVQVVKWYLSAFHAGRKSSVAKKPYNPILGEMFVCSWPVPGLKDSLRETASTELPRILRQSAGSDSDLVLIAEQVSHHPPISAFYAEHSGKRLQVDAHIWTKSKFLGLSIAVLMVGQGCVSVLDHNEEYIITFPNGYGRSILTTPWVELGGKCSVSCAKTGYSAEIEFLTKPFYGGKPHCLKADVFRPNQKSPFLSIKGVWNGVMVASRKGSHTDEVFLDVTKMGVVKKVVQPVVKQDEFESRRMWRHVTAALKRKDVVKATAGKHWLEQRQRAEAKERAASKAVWETKHFQENGEHWVYRDPLQKRMRSRRSSSASSQDKPRVDDL